MATPEIYGDTAPDVLLEPIEAAEVIDIRTKLAARVGEKAVSQVIVEEIKEPVRTLAEHARALILDGCIRRVHDGSLKPEEAMTIYNSYDPDHPMTLRDIYPNSY